MFTVSGVAAVPERLYVKYRAPGGAQCAPTANEDSGSILEKSWSWQFYGDEVNGDFSLQHVFTWEPPGTFAFCIWLASGGETITNPIAQQIKFRAPTGTISAAVSPAMPAPGQQATITITGASEAPEDVFATIRRSGGAPCAQTYEADTGQGLVSNQEVNGAFSVQATTKQQQAGTYVVCLWLASSASDTSPVAGPQPITFTVGYPAPPPLPSPSNACLKDRANLAKAQLLVRSYRTKLKSRHLSRRAARNYRRGLSRASQSAKRYASLRHYQCPGGA